MYVGITRAMRLLTLTYARRRAVYGGAPNYGLPSRFLAELPPDLIDREGSGRRRGAGRPSRAARPRPAPDLMGDSSTSGGSGGSGGGVSAPFRTGDDVVHAPSATGSCSRRSRAGSSWSGSPRTARSASSWPSTPDPER
jgi:DNA helicase-2/ATP-dependent DNA helicase PcrA